MTGGTKVITITKQEEWVAQLEKAKAEGKACVVDFHAQWCGPCKMIKPLFEQMSQENDDIYFLSIDVDDVPTVAESCGITAMPTFHVYKDGVKAAELVGASQDKLKAMVASFKKA